MPLDLLQFRQFLTSGATPAQVKATLDNNPFSILVNLSEAGGPAISVVTLNSAEMTPKPIIMQTTNNMLMSPTIAKSPSFHSSVLNVTPAPRPAFNAQALTGIRLALDDANDVMVTTRLNGCSLVFQKSRPGHDYVRIVHLQPTMGWNGQQLCRYLLDNPPHFAADPTLPAFVFGRLHQSRDDADVNIIALRRGGRWTLYAQEYNLDTKAIFEVHVIPLYEL
jgi:hypothetical protein